MIIMAAGVVLGGVDRILGNRLGYGEKFEEGFKLLGISGIWSCPIWGALVNNFLFFVYPVFYNGDAR